jgi:hypothetical protein
MAMVPEVPDSQSLGSTRTTARAAVAWTVAVLAGSAVVGLLGGLIWGELAPRVLLQEVGPGTAQIINTESRAFFGGDVWFSGIAVVAGLLTGVLGYRFAVAPRDGAARPAVAAALILGALAGGLVMLWLGERIGLSAYNHHLAASPDGTRFGSPLALGAKSALALWPLFTAIVVVVAEWGTGPVPEEPPS